MEDYDAWLFTDSNEETKEERARDEAIERIMIEHNIDWDDAELYLDDLIASAKEDHAASLAEDLAYFSQEEAAK